MNFECGFLLPRISSITTQTPDFASIAPLHAGKAQTQYQVSPLQLCANLDAALLVLRHVILLLKQVSPNLALLQSPKVPLCTHDQPNPPSSSSSFCYPIKESHGNNKKEDLTSQLPTLLQMIDPLSVITLPQLLPDQPRHHVLHPLLPEYGVLRGFQGWSIVVVDAIECGRDLGLLGEEGGGFGGWHLGAVGKVLGGGER